MAIMKPKTATAALPSVTDYQKKLAESVAAYKPQLESYLASKSQYDAQKKAYDKWQSSLNAAQSAYDQAYSVAQQMGGSPALQGYYNTLQSIKASQPPAPGAFTGTLPTSPTGTKFAGNALSYFNPTEYGVTGLQAELEKVRKDEASGSKIMKKPRYTFDVTQLEQNLLDKTTLDLSKLGDFGGVLGQMAGAGSTGQVYVPKAALSQLAEAYKDYGLGDITQAVTDKAAWDVASPALSKYVKLPQGYSSVTPEQLAAKKAYEDLLSAYNAQKADWTTKIYEPYQSDLNAYNSQFTDTFYKDYPGAGPWPAKRTGTRYLPNGMTIRWAPTSGSSGFWVAETEQGYQKLNPSAMGDWKYAWQNHFQYPNLMYQEPIFASSPGVAPVFSQTAPTAPEAYTGEHQFADLSSSQGGTGTSALGQLLRKTHGRTMGGIQNAGTEQALTQQLYGSGGLSPMGRLLSQGTNESLGGISNPMLRGMLSQQLFD